MKTQSNIQFKFTLIFFILCFWWSEASAFDWSTRPLVKIDIAGNATAVWEGTDPISSNSIIQTNYLPNGGSWTGVATLSSTSENSFAPKLDVNDGGDVVVIWKTFDSVGNTFIQAITRASAGSFGSAQNISTSGELILANYDVSLSNAGSIIASWDAYVDTSFISVIRATTSTISGGTWTPNSTISP